MSWSRVAPVSNARSLCDATSASNFISMNPQIVKHTTKTITSNYRRHCEHTGGYDIVLPMIRKPHQSGHGIPQRETYDETNYGVCSRLNEAVGFRLCQKIRAL